MGKLVFILGLFITGIFCFDLFLDSNGNDSNDGLTYATSVKTFTEIQSRLRMRNSTEQVIVNIASGKYRLSQPLNFTSMDNYPFPVTFRGNGTAEILGSITLEGNWKKNGNIYVLEGIDNIIRNKTGRAPVLPYSSLFVNGARATRARQNISNNYSGQWFERVGGGET
jgi:hypothetical protein